MSALLLLLICIFPNIEMKLNIKYICKKLKLVGIARRGSLDQTSELPAFSLCVSTFIVTPPSHAKLTMENIQRKSKILVFSFPPDNYWNLHECNNATSIATMTIVRNFVTLSLG